jgi:hypothetical protein
MMQQSARHPGVQYRPGIKCLIPCVTLYDLMAKHGLRPRGGEPADG